MSRPHESLRATFRVHPPTDHDDINMCCSSLYALPLFIFSLRFGPVFSLCASSQLVSYNGVVVLALERRKDNISSGCAPLPMYQGTPGWRPECSNVLTNVEMWIKVFRIYVAVVRCILPRHTPL